MWLVCLCVGLVAGQMMTTDSGVTDGGMTDDGSTDNLAGQTDAVEVPDTTVATEENTTTASTPTPTQGQGHSTSYNIYFYFIALLCVGHTSYLYLFQQFGP